MPTKTSAIAYRLNTEIPYYERMARDAYRSAYGTPAEELEASRLGLARIGAQLAALEALPDDASPETVLATCDRFLR